MRRERTTSSKRNIPGADGYEADHDYLFEYPPRRTLRFVTAPRLTGAAAVLGAIAGAIVTFGLLRQPAQPGVAPPAAYVPVVVATGSLPVTGAPSVAPTRSANSASASASPRRSASPSAHASPTPSPSPTLSPSLPVSPSPVVSRLAPRGYEGDASDNIIAGGSFVGSCSQCPDGTKVRYIGRGGTLTFPHVTASVAGDYTLSVVYTEGDTSGGRKAVVSVNGVGEYEYFGGNGDWNSVQTLTMTVYLVAGQNSIEFSNPDALGPDVAEIIV